jgi:hypothetical protein
MFKKSVLTLSLALVLTSPALASQADIDAELNSYIATFSGNDEGAERLVLEKLVWAGYSSEALFDVIAKKLRSVKAAKDGDSKRYAKWYTRALSMSGNDKYLEVLEDVASTSENKKIREYAQRSISTLATYKNWNTVISSGLETAPDGRLEETRVMNMMNAEDSELFRLGAKRLYHGHSGDQVLVNEAKKVLAREWRLIDINDDPHFDAVAWLMKGIALSGDASAIPLLEEIKKEAKIKKVQKYAKKALKSLR